MTISGGTLSSGLGAGGAGLRGGSSLTGSTLRFGSDAQICASRWACARMIRFSATAPVSFGCMTSVWTYLRSTSSSSNTRCS